MRRFILLAFFLMILGFVLTPRTSISKEKDNIKLDLYIPEEIDNYVKEVDDTVILNDAEIVSYNERIKEKTDALYDVYTSDPFSGDLIKEYILHYEVPSLPKYNGTVKITSKDVEKILDNRNLDEVHDQTDVMRGLIIARSNLRSFPTDLHFYNNPKTEYLDNIQETELLVNTPVLILHESKDKEWYFVLSPIYYGWIKKETVAVASRTDWDYFLSDDYFVVITDPEYKMGNKTLDMSTKLPLLGYDDDQFEVVIPMRDEKGLVQSEKKKIPRESAYIGYVPYTKKNLYVQSLKYRGVKYEWGGYTGGVDCSSFVANVFRTFGFQFPRNTSSQNGSVGTIVDVSKMSDRDKLEAIEKNSGSLLYQSGHVMIYLGKQNGKNYIIHANGKTLDVAVTVLEGSSYLSKINKIVIIDNVL